MHLENAILDIEAQSCLDQELMELKKFNTIENCLQTYENSGQMPELTVERSQYYYARS